jgi:hypothetical protein
MREECSLEQQRLLETRLFSPLKEINYEQATSSSESLSSLAVRHCYCLQSSLRCSVLCLYDKLLFREIGDCFVEKGGTCLSIPCLWKVYTISHYASLSENYFPDRRMFGLKVMTCHFFASAALFITISLFAASARANFMNCEHLGSIKLELQWEAL